MMEKRREQAPALRILSKLVRTVGEGLCAPFASLSEGGGRASARSEGVFLYQLSTRVTPSVSLTADSSLKEGAYHGQCVP